MTKKEMTKKEKVGATVTYIGLAAMAIFGGPSLIRDYVKHGPRLVKLEYHWVQMQTDAWAYAPTDDGGPVWSPDVNIDNEPVGGIVKTSEGAWKTIWRLKPCGAGEYLNRELAEQCIENAAQYDGFFGYHIRTPKPAPEAKP